jgi:pimeloyl-ACP methyl ester carboxylesterase
MLPNMCVIRLQGGRQVEFTRMGTGGPVVVFEAGGGMRMTTWKKVLPAVAAFTNAVAYNRAGFGNSSPVNAPRNGPTIVRELRAFLQDVGLNPPYVLVGHSLGGLYMQLFTRLHPDEVAGLVLVDPTPPFMDMAKQATEALTLSAAIWAVVLRHITKGFHALVGRAATEELGAIEQSAQAVLQTPTPTGVPVIILISARKSVLLSQRQWETVKNIQGGLLDLFPGCQWRPVNCGHAIHVSAPETVASAIRECVRQ